MRITKNYLRRIIKEYKEGRLNEYSEYASHTDLSDHMDDMFGMMEEVMMKYVDSGWLANQDQTSLAISLEKLYDEMNRLNNTFSQISATGKAKK